MPTVPSGPGAVSPERSRPPALRRFVRLVAANVLVLAVLLIGVEGLASFALLSFDLRETFVPSYRRHTDYDPELGWVNRPDVHLPDLYGHGVSLTTNSAGFRNTREFAVRVPEGKYRVVCTGDSFTLGVGVDNEHTWCHLLTVLDPRVEAVNMGQPGYGVDQAYLLYKRAGSRIGHDAHLFALIGADIDRMQSEQFQGYDKPVFDLESGALALKNVPVPRRSYVWRWLTDRKAIFGTLRAVGLTRRLRHRAGAEPPAPGGPARTEDGRRKTREILRLLLADLKRLNSERGSELLLVYLPALPDVQPGAPGGWLESIEEDSRTLGVPLIDVRARFRNLPPEDVRSLFFLPGQAAYPSANHLNERGNDFVAKVIGEELKARVDRKHR